MTFNTASPEELKLISGLQRPSAICRFLSEHRIPYLTGADGWPRVLSAIIVERMGGKQAPPVSVEPQLRLRNG